MSSVDLKSDLHNKTLENVTDSHSPTDPVKNGTYMDIQIKVFQAHKLNF
jgi:hypothetical protein